MISISSGILDNDPKGRSGRGTKFWLEAGVVGEDVTRFEYHLLDLIDGTFNREAVLKPLLDRAEAARKAEEQRQAAEKKAALEKRQADVTINTKLEAIIDTVIAMNQKAVDEFKSGKDKALNSLVGLVIKEAKVQQLVPDAFAITTAIKQKLVV